MRLLFYAPFALGCLAIFFVSGMERPPVPEALSFRFADKLLHTGAYAVLCAFALLGAVRRAGARPLVEALALTVLYGALDELHQAFIPGRSATVADWLADATGALLAVLAWWLWTKRRSRTQPPVPDVGT